MPPEAFDGRHDTRGDLYSLGLTLYELLAFRPAFDEKDRARLIRQVTNDDIPRLRKFNPEVPRDLETVVHKAIDREPAHRYQSAAELAEDLRRFVEDRPVRARRSSETEKLLRWCRRNPLPAGLLTMLMLVLLIGSALVTWKWREAVTERDAKEEQRMLADLAAGRAVAEEQKRASRPSGPDAVSITVRSPAPGWSSRPTMSPTPTWSSTAANRDGAAGNGTSSRGSATPTCSR